MTTYRQTLKTTKSSTPESLDLTFIGPMLPKKVESKKVESKKVESKKVESDKEVVEKKRIIKVYPSDQYVMENRSYLDLIKEYESIAKIKVETKAKKRIINRPIFCYVNDKPYNSLCDALRQHGISLDKKTSPWFKINRELKKHGEYQHGKLKFSLQ